MVISAARADDNSSTASRSQAVEDGANSPCDFDGEKISAEVTVQPSLSAEVLCLVRSHRTVRTLCLLAPGEWVGLGSRRRPQKDASYFAGQSGLPGRLRW